jgi:hypothetical protein
VLPKASSRQELPTNDQMDNTPPLSKTVPIKTTKTSSLKKGKEKAWYVFGSFRYTFLTFT